MCSLVQYILDIQVAPANPVAVNEAVGEIAQKELDDQAEDLMNKKKAEKLKFWRKVSLVYNPVIALTFVAIYWIAGLKHAGYV